MSTHSCTKCTLIADLVRALEILSRRSSIEDCLTRFARCLARQVGAPYCEIRVYSQHDKADAGLQLGGCYCGLDPTAREQLRRAISLEASSVEPPRPSTAASAPP